MELLTSVGGDSGRGLAFMGSLAMIFEGLTAKR